MSMVSSGRRCSSPSTLTTTRLAHFPLPGILGLLLLMGLDESLAYPLSFKYHDLADIIHRTCMTLGSVPSTARHYTITSGNYVMPTSLQTGTELARSSGLKTPGDSSRPPINVVKSCAMMAEIHPTPQGDVILFLLRKYFTCCFPKCVRRSLVLYRPLPSV